MESRGRIGAWLVRAGLLLSALAACGVSAATPKRVLILDSFGHDVAPFSVVVSAFRTTLARELGQPVDIYEVPLDTARFADPDFEKPLVDFLEQRLAGSPVDLVVPVGAPAVRFATQHRERLFAETPIVFADADPRTVPSDALKTNATLVTQKADLPGMIEDILQLQPETTNIVVVVGISPLGKFWAGELRREWQAFTNRVGFSWLDNLSLQQMQERVQTLPPRSFIVFAMLLMDADRVPYDGYEALDAIAAAANAPLFGYFRSQLGRGVIGGRLYQDSQVGTQAAKVAIRILRGERAADIPPEILRLSPPTYDWRELTRWGIRPDRLPAGSVIEFREPTFWEQYRWRVMGVAAFCCLQTALIIGLIINRAKRREVQAVASLIADLSSRFVNLPAGKVDAEIEAAQRRICECLGLDILALWQWSVDRPDDLVLTHVCRLLDGPPIPEPMSAREHFPWLLQEVKAKRCFALASLEEAPAGAARDVEVLRQFGIKSDLTIPLAAGEAPTLGAVSFNTVRAERAWPEEVVQRLQVLAQIFANALARKRADQELRESEARLSLAAEAAAAGLWRLDLATQCFWLTKKTRELFAFGADEVVTFDRFLNLVHPEDRELVRQRVQRALESKTPIQVEYRILQPDGRVRWMKSQGRIQGSPLGQPDCLMGVTVDVTRRKEAEEALRDFSARFIRAQEQDRSRLARELHDDITQRLARLAIDLAQCERKTPPAPPAESLRTVREGLVQLSKDVHALSYQLHPSILEDLGLAEALKVEAERFERQGGNPIKVMLQDIPGSISPDAALCLFRVAQEALRNAARHAHAQQITLSLRGLDGGLQLAIQDDGCGFDATLKRDRPSLGIAGMRERVHLAGGELDIESAPNRGTTVLAWVAIQKK